MLDLQRHQADAVADALAANYDDNSLKATTASHVANNIFDSQGWVGKLKEAARTPLLYAWLSGASHELLAFGQVEAALPTPTDAAANQKDADLGFDFGVDLPDEVKVGVARGIRRSLDMPYWSDIEATKLDDLEESLRAGINAGKPLREIVKGVRGVFDGAIGKDRALTIARTETTGALNAGAQQAQFHLADEGIVDGKEWLDTADSRTRITHLDAGGQRVGVREKFLVGGYQCDHPGDPALPAKERCRCRCASSGFTSFEHHDSAPSAGVSRPAPASHVEITIGGGLSKEQFQARMDEILGKGLSLDDLGPLIGAQSGAKIKAYAGSGYVQLSLTHADYDCMRTIHPGHVVNDNVHVYDHAPDGFGRKIFTEQVEHAAALVFTRIETEAAGSYVERNVYNGYYTWPRFGYDAWLHVAFKDNAPLLAKIRAKFPEATRISDEMIDPAGREWWLRNGQTFSCSFDLREDSLNRRVLREYNDEKRAERQE